MKFCKNCQTETVRYPSGGCKPCDRARKVAWRSANPERYRAINAARYAARADKVKAYNAAWRAANSEKAKASSAAWYAANPEKAKANRAAWYAANPEKRRASRAAWAKANPEMRRVNDQNRRARKLANGGRLSPSLSQRLFKLQRGKCACGCKQPLGDNYHLDHIMPLALGGSNTDDNIQLLRQHCNNKKGKKHPVEFMQSLGFLI